jgi:hypothetical protein
MAGCRERPASVLQHAHSLMQALEAGAGAFAQCALLILPVVDYCSDAMVAALSAWSSGPSGSVHRILAVTAGPPRAPVACGADEYAVDRDPASLAFLSGASSGSLSEALSLLHTTVEPAFVKTGSPRLVKCIQAGSSGLIAFGVLCKWAIEPGGLSALFWALNTLTTPFQLALLWDPALGGGTVLSGEDVLTNETVELGVNGTSIDAEGVLFLRLDVSASAARATPGIHSC